MFSYRYTTPAAPVTIMTAIRNTVIGLGAEPIIWASALLYLAIIDPSASGTFTLCPLHNLGLPFCPGCGLGHSVSYLLHGDVTRSLEAHPLGAAAVVILMHHLFSLFMTRTGRIPAPEHSHTH